MRPVGAVTTRDLMEILLVQIIDIAAKVDQGIISPVDGWAGCELVIKGPVGQALKARVGP